MVKPTSNLTGWLCVLGLVFALLYDCRSTCRTAEPEDVSSQKPRVGPQTVGPVRVIMGEIRGVLTADGSSVRCSEILDLREPTIVKTFEIYRNSYAVNAAKGTFTDTPGLIGVPWRTSGRSSHSNGGRFFGGKSESILATWECRSPPSKGLYVVTSLAVLELADGRHMVCRFRPLFFANGRIVTRDEGTVDR
jgi:hypothetical protein